MSTTRLPPWRQLAGIPLNVLFFLLLMDVGFAGVFRSVPAVALLSLVFWMFKRRMDVEEAFMTRCFGDEYCGYAARTARLLPGVC